MPLHKTFLFETNYLSLFYNTNIKNTITLSTSEYLRLSGVVCKLKKTHYGLIFIIASMTAFLTSFSR